MKFGRICSCLIIITLLASLMISTVAIKQKVLFYETQAGGYSIDSGYSYFANELKDGRYEVRSTKEEITQDLLKDYDVLVMQNLGGKLSDDEIATVMYWFVGEQGKGLFISGGEPAGVNPLSLIAGIQMDSGTLVDETQLVPGANNNQYFTIHEFYTQIMARTTISSVYKLGFYGGHGLQVFGDNSVVIAGGDDDTYYLGKIVTIGSRPSVAAAAVIGNGPVFVTSDVDILANSYVNGDAYGNKYDNMRFGENIIDWLSTGASPIEKDNVTLTIMLAKQEALSLEIENEKLEDDIKDKTDQIDALIGENSRLSEELEGCETSGGIFGFSYSQIAVGLLAILIILMVLSHIGQKKEMHKPEDELKPEESSVDDEFAEILGTNKPIDL